MDKNGKKNRLIFSLVLAGITFIILGTTYAFINVRLTGTKRQVITTGNLSLELMEDENNLTITNALPMYDDVGMIQAPFTFRLSNNTSMDTNYIVKLVDITTGEKLDTSIVKYGLTKDGQSTIKSLFSLRNGQIDKGIIKGEQTIEYALRIWIDASVEDDTLINGKSLSYRIDVEVSQEMGNTEVIGIGGNLRKIAVERDFDGRQYYYNCDDSFCEHGSLVTAVIFEPSIDIPTTAYRSWDMSVEQDGSVMVYEERILVEGADVNPDLLEPVFEYRYKLHVQANGKISANPDSSFLFGFFGSLQSIEGLEYLDTSNVTNMSYMFRGLEKLTSLDLSSFNTSKVTDMSNMFSGCNRLVSLDLSSFDISNVSQTVGIFGGINIDCEIVVKDEATKAWVLEQKSSLTNVVVKGTKN